MKLEDFEKDYEESKKPIQNITLYNIKIFFKRRQKSFKLYKKFFGPALITGMVSLPIFKGINLGTPFAIDEYKIYNYQIKNINDETIGYEYIDIKQKTFIKVVNEWEPYNDIFARKIDYYELDDINNFKSLDELKKIKTEQEFASNPEFDGGSYTILFYNRLDQQYNLIAESNVKNHIASGLYSILLVLSLMYGAEKIMDDDSYYQLDELYPYMNMDAKKTLEKQLKKKEENLKFLKGDNDEIKRSK